MGNVPLQIGPDEILAPAQAARGTRRQQALGKAAAQPQIVDRQVAGFQDSERRQFQISDASSQRFARLFEELQACGTQYQVLSGPAPLPALAVYQAAQDREKTGGAMNLVENHQLVEMVRQIQLGLGQLAAIRFRFQVEVHEWPGQGFGRLPGQRRLAHLTRADQSDGR